MNKIQRFGKFLPPDIKLKVYHGSRNLFTKFSNEFNRTGNGKNIYGWGIYVSTDIDHAAGFALDYHWSLLLNDIVIDGKVYDVETLKDSMYETIEYNGMSDDNNIRGELLNMRFSNMLDNTLDKDLIIRAYTIIRDYIDKNNMPGRILVRQILSRLKDAKNITFKQKSVGYIYECELSVGKLFKQELSPSDIHFIKGQLRKEGINEDIFDDRTSKSHRDYSNNVYHNLVNYYSSLGKKKDTVRAERRASLFLYRCGFQSIECSKNEYVVIDINCLKINKTIKV